MSTTQQIANWLADSHSAVAFTGAGISTESGIPDFRSPGGIWATSQPVYYDEFVNSAEARYEYWRQKAIAHQDFAASQPNTGHKVLARWEAAGRLACVVTQNIDGLHKEAERKTSGNCMERRVKSRACNVTLVIRPTRWSHNSWPTMPCQPVPNVVAHC